MPHTLERQLTECLGQEIDAVLVRDIVQDQCAIDPRGHLTIGLSRPANGLIHAEVECFQIHLECIHSVLGAIGLGPVEGNNVPGLIGRLGQLKRPLHEEGLAHAIRANDGNVESVHFV